jgi:hypothetical protein
MEDIIDRKSLWEGYEITSNEQVKNIIKNNINRMCDDWISTGFALKQARDKGFYKEDGYSSIQDYAFSEFGLKKQRVSRLIKIIEDLSVNGNSPVLEDKWREFSIAKLEEIIYLDEDEKETIEPVMTLVQIRNAGKKESVIEVSAPKLEPEEKSLPLPEENTTLQDDKPNPQAITESLAKEVAIWCIGYLWDELLPVKEKGDFSEILESKLTKKSFVSGDMNMEFKLAYIKVSKSDSEHFVLYSDVSKQIQNEWNTVAALRKKNETGPKHCMYDNKTLCAAVCSTGAECCRECPEHGSCNGECGWLEERIPRPEQEIVNDTTEPVNETLDSVTEPESEVITERGCSNCKYNIMPREDYFQDHPDTNEFPCDNCDSKIHNWRPDIGIVEPVVDSTVEQEPEIVEADVIQTETDPEKYSIADIQGEIREHTNNLAILRRENVVTPIRFKNKMRLDAASALLDKLREPIVEVESEAVQPELPILKNNDQRKDFIDNYTSWPVWIDLPHTGEKYYRYDLSGKVAIVVKVSRKHAWKTYKETTDYEYGAEQYYLLGIKMSCSTKMIYDEDDSRTFYECNSNKSALVEYLKEIQKK